MNRNDFVRTMHSKLDKWSNEIAGLIERKEHMAESVRSTFGSRMDDLRGSAAKAREELVQIESASEDAWQDIKAGIELSWDALGDAVESARAHFKESSDSARH